MTTKHRLKAKDIFTLPDGFHPDGDGLYLTVNGNARSWVLKYQFNKKTRKCGLGSCRYVTLAQAREKVMKIKGSSSFHGKVAKTLKICFKRA